MTRLLALVAACAVALGLAGCGSNDNGGVIQGPTGTTTTAPGATTTAGGGNSSSGY
jgi:hypothetical protein